MANSPSLSGMRKTLLSGEYSRASYNQQRLLRAAGQTRHPCGAAVQVSLHKRLPVSAFDLQGECHCRESGRQAAHSRL